MSWNWEFDDPLSLPNGDQALTLREAGEFIVTLPVSETTKPEWQQAIRLLLDAAELPSRLGEAFSHIEKILATLRVAAPIELFSTPPMDARGKPDAHGSPNDVAVLLSCIAKVRAVVGGDATPEATIDAIRYALDDAQLGATIAQLEKLQANQPPRLRPTFADVPRLLIFQPPGEAPRGPESVEELALPFTAEPAVSSQDAEPHLATAQSAEAQDADAKEMSKP